MTTSGSPTHTHLDKLKGCFSEDIREKVWLTHFENEEVKALCTKEKFQTVEVEK